MTLEQHAEFELRKAGLYDADSDYGGGLAEAVMELIKTFSAQGHSGYSASSTIKIFSILANYETLSPLTGEDDEWSEVWSNVTDGLLQNKRNSAVFKNMKTGKANYLNAITWKTPNGSTWTGWADGIGSSQNIKSFPFSPKTFTIDVIEEEVKKDDWLFHLKNPDDLNKVWEYYDKKEVPV